MRTLVVSSMALASALALSVPAHAQDAVAVPADTHVVGTPAGDVVITAPDGYSMIDFQTVTAEQLTGSRLYDVTGADVGEIVDIVIGADNNVTGIITDIGGFLGMGEHRVMLSPDEVEVYTDADGTAMTYVRLSDEALKALPAYEAP